MVSETKVLKVKICEKLPIQPEEVKYLYVKNGSTDQVENLSVYPTL